MPRMEVSKIPKYRKLVKEDRILVAQWKNSGFSNKQIAKWLGRSVSTIGREIGRNSFEGKVYEPLHAQLQAGEQKAKTLGIPEEKTGKKKEERRQEKPKSENPR